jgi:hypothetical protein
MFRSAQGRLGDHGRRARGRRVARSMGRRSYPSARLPVHARLTLSLRLPCPSHPPLPALHSRSRRARHDHALRDDDRRAREHVPLLRARRLLPRRRLAREQGAPARVGRLPRGDAPPRVEGRARAGPWPLLARAALKARGQHLRHAPGDR